GCLWKNSGFSPPKILSEASRSAHYTESELLELDFEGSRPRLAELSAQWKEALSQAKDVVALLPLEEVGKCALDRRARLFRGDAAALEQALAQGQIQFHAGSIRGAMPSFLNLEHRSS
ncbi:MAG TPA: hypothetical protein PKH07_15185, partial [bacterium]|nr:hypothetical protein [bacterium]